MWNSFHTGLDLDLCLYVPLFAEETAAKEWKLIHDRYIHLNKKVNQAKSGAPGIDMLTREENEFMQTMGFLQGHINRRKRYIESIVKGKTFCKIFIYVGVFDHSSYSIAEQCMAIWVWDACLLMCLLTLLPLLQNGMRLLLWMGVMKKTVFHWSTHSTKREKRWWR